MLAVEQQDGYCTARGPPAGVQHATENQHSNQTMYCERCGKDTLVEKHEVDGFTGYLCRDCLDEWEQIRAA